MTYMARLQLSRAHGAYVGNVERCLTFSAKLGSPTGVLYWWQLCTVSCYNIHYDSPNVPVY